MKKSNVLLDKPIIIGFTILEIAKLEMSIHYDRLKIIFRDNMQLLYTDTDSFKLFIKNTNPYKLKKHVLEDYFDTSNFSADTIFPSDPGKYEKWFGRLKCENGECTCLEFSSKPAETYEEKRINQLRSIKAKGLKRGFKDNILDNDFKNVSLDKKPLRVTQKQIKSKNLNMAMEDVEKDVIPVYSNKRESFLGLYKSFPWIYRGNKYKLLLSTFRNNDTPSRKTINELLKIYPNDLFNFDYLEQYWDDWNK